MAFTKIYHFTDTIQTVQNKIDVECEKVAQQLIVKYENSTLNMNSFHEALKKALKEENANANKYTINYSSIR